MRRINLKQRFLARGTITLVKLLLLFTYNDCSV